MCNLLANVFDLYVIYGIYYSGVALGMESRTLLVRQVLY